MAHSQQARLRLSVIEWRVRLPLASNLDVLHHCTTETVESGHETRQLRAGHQSSRHPGRPSASRATGASPPSFPRSEEHTSELQSLMRISYAVFCLKKTNHTHISLL